MQVSYDFFHVGGYFKYPQMSCWSFSRWTQVPVGFCPEKTDYNGSLFAKIKIKRTRHTNNKCVVIR